MKRGFVDRVKRAYRELTGDGAGSPWKAGESNRLNMDWVLSHLTPDDEVRASLRKLRGRARDLAKNDSYVKNFLRLMATNVIGAAGISLHSQVKTAAGEPDLATNRAIEAAWKRWATGRVTVDGKFRLLQLEQMLIKTLARDGEVFVRKYLGFKGNPFGFALQPIEPDLIDESYNQPAGRGQAEIRMGIEVDPLGKPVAYHIWDRPLASINTTPRERKRIPAAEVIHIFVPERIGQTRGITWFDSVMVPTKMLEGYEEAELVAARIGAAKMGFVVSKGENTGLNVDPDDPKAGQKGWDATPGSIEQLEHGQEFQGWDPQHPTQAFPAFVKTIIRKISTGLGCSYNSLSNDLESVNFSSMRAGKQDERDSWEVLQDLWISDFRQDIYPDWMGMALLSGALSLPSRDSSRYQDLASWGPRGWDWVDPLKDAQTAQLQLQLGLTSRRRITAKTGERYEEILMELKEENEAAAAAGVNIAGPTTVTVQAEKDPADEDDDGKKHSLAIV